MLGVEGGGQIDGSFRAARLSCARRVYLRLPHVKMIEWADWRPTIRSMAA